MNRANRVSIDDLLSEARSVRDHADAPYSHYFVGAAFVSKAGHVYKGCNVENISYGLSCCAERNAIAQGVTFEGPGLRIQTLVVLNQTEDDCSPCGAYRQVIKEFSSPESRILFRSGGVLQDISMTDLLPLSFSFVPEAARGDLHNG